MKLRLSGLAASDSICWPTLQALMAPFCTCLLTLSPYCHQSELPSCLRSFILHPNSHTTSSQVSSVSFSSLQSAWLKLDLLCLSRKGLFRRFCCATVWTQMPCLDYQAGLQKVYCLGRICKLGGRDEWRDGGRFLELYYPLIIFCLAFFLVGDGWTVLFLFLWHPWGPAHSCGLLKGIDWTLGKQDLRGRTSLLDFLYVFLCCCFHLFSFYAWVFGHIDATVPIACESFLSYYEWVVTVTHNTKKEERIFTTLLLPDR